MDWIIRVIVVIVVLAAAVAIALLAYVNIRAHRLDNRLGSFRCWSRPDSQSGWTSGIGFYGVETLEWHRLVGFGHRPVYTLSRRELEISAPIERSVDGTVVEVRLSSGESRYEIAVATETYNALVSWVESGPPLARR